MKPRKLTEEESREYFYEIFHKALEKDWLDALSAILRIEGMEDRGWDTFQEIINSFEDYNWLVEMAEKKSSDKCVLRLNLLMYCQAIEITAIHDLLANLFRILSGKHCVYMPFFDLHYRKTGEIGPGRPPGLKIKFKRIKELSVAAGEDKFPEMIESFFDDRIRNAFSHSDYTLIDETFRFKESGIGEIGFEELNNKIKNCFFFKIL